MQQCRDPEVEMTLVCLRIDKPVWLEGVEGWHGMRLKRRQEADPTGSL